MQVGWKTLALVPNVNSYLCASDVGQWNTKFAFKSLEKKNLCCFIRYSFSELKFNTCFKVSNWCSETFSSKISYFLPLRIVHRLHQRTEHILKAVQLLNNLNMNLYPCMLNINVVISQTISRLWGRRHYWVKRVCFVPYRHCTSMKASAEMSLLYLLGFLKRKVFFSSP